MKVKASSEKRRKSEKRKKIKCRNSKKEMKVWK
jgi:hypothetical protein